MSVLPDKPSELIETALRDLEAVERLPETYRVDMRMWHSWGSSEKKCYVCLAGAVMAQSLGAGPERDLDPTEFDEEYSKLIALNYFRCGDITVGLMHMSAWKTEYEDKIEDRHVPQYNRDDGRSFKEEIRKMVEYLREKGL